MHKELFQLPRATVVFCRPLPNLDLVPLEFRHSFLEGKKNVLLNIGVQCVVGTRAVLIG